MSLIVLLVIWTTRARCTCRLLTLIFLLIKETPRLGVMVALFLLSQVSNKHVQTQCTYLPILVSLSVCPSVYLLPYQSLHLPVHWSHVFTTFVHTVCQFHASSTFQILLIMSHPPLVSSLVDVLVNGDEVASDGTPEDSPLPLRKVSCFCYSMFKNPLDPSFNFVSFWKC